MQDVPDKPFTPQQGIFDLNALAYGQRLFGDIKIGDQNVEIDGKNRRILIYDANGVPAVLIGNLEVVV